jgi:hypothetical protein
VNLELAILAKQTCGYCLISIVSQKSVSNGRFSFFSAGIHECAWSSISSKPVSGNFRDPDDSLRMISSFVVRYVELAGLLFWQLWRWLRSELRLLLGRPSGPRENLLVCATPRSTF